MNMRRKLAPRFNLKQLSTPREDTVSLRPSIRQTHRPKPRSTGSNPANPQTHRKLLQQGISEPEFHGDLVLNYRIRQIVGKFNFSEQFRKLINRYKRIG